MKSAWEQRGFFSMHTNENRNTFELMIIFLLKRAYINRNNNINKGYTEENTCQLPRVESGKVKLTKCILLILENRKYIRESKILQKY